MLQGNNDLSGPLPSLKGYNLLHILHLFHTSFYGTIPEDISDAFLLTDVSLSNNM